MAISNQLSMHEACSRLRLPEVLVRDFTQYPFNERTLKWASPSNDAFNREELEAFRSTWTLHGPRTRGKSPSTCNATSSLKHGESVRCAKRRDRTTTLPTSFLGPRHGVIILTICFIFVWTVTVLVEMMQSSFA